MREKIRFRVRLAASLVLAFMVSASPARAGWREDMGVFRIGLLAGSRTEGELGLIRAEFAKALGMPAEIAVLRDYTALIDAQATQRVDYAVYSALAFGAADQLCRCVESLAAPVSETGATGMRAILIGRAGEFDSLNSAPVKPVAFGPADSAPAMIMLNAGLKLGGEPMNAGSSHVKIMDSASAAVADFADGGASGLSGWAPSTASGVLEGGVPEALAARGMLRGSWSVLWTSGYLPNGPHAVRRNLPAEAKAILKAYLAGLAAASPETYSALEQEFSGGFAPAATADYSLAAAIAAASAGKAK